MARRRGRWGLLAGRGAGAPCRSRRAQGEPAPDRAPLPAVQANPARRQRPDPGLRSARRDPVLPARRSSTWPSRRAPRPAVGARRRDDRHPDCDRRARCLADTALEPRRPGGDARPAHGGLQAPAAALARLLHPHPHRRGSEPDRQRHRRDRERGDVHRDVGRLQRDDGARHGRRDAAPRLAASRSSRSRSCRSSSG